MAPPDLACNVVVLDANDLPISNVTVTPMAVGPTVSKPTQTARDGSCKILIPDDFVQAGLSLAVSHPNYIPEVIRFKPRQKLTTSEFSNPLLERGVDAQTGNIKFTVRLGRLAVVPTKEFSANEIKTFSTSPAKDPRAASLSIALNSSQNGTRLVYADHVNRNNYVSLVGAWALPPASALPLPNTNPPPQFQVPKDKAGWERFANSRSRPVQTLENGRFFFLMYGAGTGKQYAIAVWSPNLPRDKPTPVTKVWQDIIYYYSPNTGHCTKTYPFGYHAAEYQEYMDLANIYLLNGYLFIPQLIARNRNAVIIMPLSNHGDWGSFSMNCEGVFRLCREVLLFLHREGRTVEARPPHGPVPLGGVPEQTEWAGGSLRDPTTTPLWHDNWARPPAVGRLVISAFSQSIGMIRNLIDVWVGGDSALWGCPKISTGPGWVDPERAFRNCWRELWDFDGYQDQKSKADEPRVWGVYYNLCRKWFLLDSTAPGIPGASGPANGVFGPRMLRIWQTVRKDGDNHPPNPFSSPHPLWVALRATSGFRALQVMMEPGADGTGLAVEMHGGMGGGGNTGDTWSVVWYEEGYQNKNDNAGGQPGLVDTHHSAPMLAWSQYLALSPVGTAVYPGWDQVKKGP